MRKCVMCDTPIEGRSDKQYCGVACQVRRHRLRKAAQSNFREVLFSLESKDSLLTLLTGLQSMIEAPATDTTTPL